MTARVMVSARVAVEHAEAFERAYAEVTSKVADVPGHLGDQLLRDHDEPERYVLLSEWESTEHFLAWEDAPVHRDTTTPMRPYWRVLERRVYEVAKEGDQARAEVAGG
ncbi:antibiotic biosynthesis monooxygenase family protein [Umezawaea endophytica]|uniref:Antibiotic biosynthesis monooxygenase n=1 Tax=Umezawaea endophytica TaxID=1654476 RepID=A0A9X3AL97_9PSEU|nr:antibiotic biosynthesis monooxygenase family protein [Umezawaea endophytica]MCS7484095.1 antibiotic biosynthesis monooxygenase [Umezawaea endophytica]